MRRALLLTLAASALAAAEEPKHLSLSLAKAVEIAMAPDGATRSRLAAEQVVAAGTRQRQALAALLPNVDASYTFRDFTSNISAMGISFNSLGLPFQIPTLAGPIKTNDVRANVSQSVFDLGSIRRYQAARAQSGVARDEESAARNQTKGAVAKTYLNAVRAEAALETALANVELAGRVLRQANSQKTAGTGTGIDITRAEVQLANEKQRLIAATEDRNSARLQLLRAMNVDLDARLELTQKLRYAPAEVPAAAKALEAARELRPELKAQAGRENAARLSYESVKWERLPTVGAFGDYGTIGQTEGALLPTRTVGVQVKIPLWDGGRRDARRAESSSLLRQERIRTRDTAQQVELDIRLGIEALDSAENQVKVALEALAQSEKELEQAQRRYAAGVAISLEVTDAQARLARAREAQVAAVYRQKAARIDLGVAVGNIDMVLD